MINENLKSIVCTSLIEGVLRNYTGSNLAFDGLYKFLLNREECSKLCPFNFIRYEPLITNDETGLFRAWLADLSEGIASEAAGKRVARAVIRLARDYESIMPDALRGEATMGILFRIFYIPNEVFVSLPYETITVLQVVKFALISMVLLDMVFSAKSERVCGVPCEDLLKGIMREGNVAVYAQKYFRYS